MGARVVREADTTAGPRPSPPPAAIAGRDACSRRRPPNLSIPSRLSDQEFWKLVTDFSEPNGYFRSDNLLSNEIWLQYVIPELLSVTRPGRVYMGVGPEQNFTYIAALKPSIAFIVDIRRGNLDLHLMYKALFELSSDRVDFVSRLFARKRPEGLTASSSVQEIFNAFATAETNEALFAANLKAILDDLTKTHGFVLTADDPEGIEYVYRQFQTYGPALTYWMSGRGGGFGRNSPSYADLMLSTDEAGQARSYPGERRELRVPQDARIEEPADPGRRELRGTEGDSRGRGVPQGASQRPSCGVLSVQRRAVPEHGRPLGDLLRERRDPAARRHEPLHPIDPPGPVRLRPRAVNPRSA